MAERPATAYSLHAGRLYGLVLVPFLGLSLVVHAAVGVGYAWQWLSATGEKGQVGLETFGRPTGSSAAEVAAAEQERLLTDQPRRYRLNYFNRVVLPQPVIIAALPEPPPIEPPPVEPPPTPNTGGTTTPPVPVEPDIPPALDDPVPPLGTGDPDGEVSFTEVQIGFLEGADGQHLKIPPFTMHTLTDDVRRTDTDFARYPMLFVVADISTKRGMEDLFNWSHFFHDLLHLPGIVTPPWYLAVGEALEDPYFLTPDLAEDSLKRRWESMQLFPAQAWGDIAYDAQQELADGLQIEALAEPQVYMADPDGFVRICITGRLEDMSREELLAIATEIKSQWGMNELEFNAAKFVLFQWQSQLKANTLSAPIPGNPELQPLAIPPFQPEDE